MKVARLQEQPFWPNSSYYHPRAQTSSIFGKFVVFKDSVGGTLWIRIHFSQSCWMIVDLEGHPFSLSWLNDAYADVVHWLGLLERPTVQVLWVSLGTNKDVKIIFFKETCTGSYRQLWDAISAPGPQSRQFTRAWWGAVTSLKGSDQLTHTWTSAMFTKVTHPYTASNWIFISGRKKLPKCLAL
jgi:hypothetical protein